MAKFPYRPLFWGLSGSSPRVRAIFLPLRLCRFTGKALFVCLLTVWARESWGADGDELAGSAPIPITEIKRARPVDFDSEVLPLFKKSCLACHNATEAKGELVLETPASLLKGGETGPAVVAGKGDESLLLKLARRELKPFMPPRNNKVEAMPLQPHELGLIRLWIDQGATGTVNTAVAPIAWQALAPELNPIYAVALTFDGQYAACGRGNQIFIYHIPSGQLVTQLTDPSLGKSEEDGPAAADRDLVQALAFSPDGNYLASGSYRIVKLWRRHQNFPRFSLPYAGSQAIEVIDSSPDGKWLATAGQDHQIRIWQADNGRLVRALSGHEAGVTALKFSLDSRKLASSSLDKSVRIWNFSTGKAWDQIDLPETARTMVWFADGRLGSAGDDGLIRLWTLPEDPRPEFDGLPSALAALAVTPDGRLLATGGEEGEITIYEPDSRKLLHTLRAHAGGISALSFSPDGKFLASAGPDQTLRLWNSDSGDCPLRVQTGMMLEKLAVQPGGQLVAGAGAKGLILFWKPNAGGSRMFATNEGIVTAAALSQDGRLLATASLSQDKPVIDIRDLGGARPVKRLTGHTAAIGALAFNADNSKLISGSADKTARVWSLGEGQEISKFTGHTQGVTAVQFHPLSEQAFSGSADHSLQLWNIYNHVVEKTFLGHQGPITTISVSSDGQLTISASGSMVRVWRDAAVLPVYAIACRSAVRSVAIGDKRGEIAVGEVDGSVSIYQLADGKFVGQLTSPIAPVESVTYAPDQSRLLTKTADNSIRVWDTATRVSMESISLIDVSFVFFSGVSNELVVGYKDRAIGAVSLQAQRPLHYTNEIAALSFNAPGTLLLAASSNGNFQAWNCATRKPAFRGAHGSGVSDLACSSDGNWIATAGEDGHVRLWNGTNGSAASGPELPALPGPVQQIKFVPGDKQLAALTRGGAAYLLNRKDGWIDQVFWPRGLPLASLVISGTNADVFLGGPAGRPLTIRKIPRGRQFNDESKPIQRLEITGTNEQTMVSSSTDGTVRVWESATGKVTRRMKGGGEITAMAARADGKRIVTGGSTGAVLWNAESGESIAELKGDPLARELLKQLERKLVLARAEMTYQKGIMEDAERRRGTESQAVKKAVETLEAAEKSLAEKQAAARKAGEEKSSADKAMAGAVANLKKAKEAKEAGSSMMASAAGASNKLDQAKSNLEKASGEKAAAQKEIREIAEKTAQKPEIKTPPGEGGTIGALESPAAAWDLALDKLVKSQLALDQALLAKQEAQKTLAETIPKLKELSSREDLEKMFNEQSKIHADAEAQFKKTEKELAAAEQALKQAETARGANETSVLAGFLRLRKIEDEIGAAKEAVATSDKGQKKIEVDLAGASKAYEQSVKPILSVAFSPDNQVVAIAGDDPIIYTWNADNGKAYDRFKRHTAPVQVLDYLTDGTLISASADQTVLAWPPAGKWTLERAIGTGDQSSPLVDRVLSLEFSPDGQWLATGGGIPTRSGEVKIWQIADGAFVREFKDAHSDTVFSISFSPDNRHVASGAADKFVKVFDLFSGSLVRSFEGHTHHVLGVSWRPDGRVLASSGADKVVKVWDFVTGNQKKTIEGFNKEVTSIHYVEASSEVLVTSGDNQVRLLREDGNNVRSFAGGTDFMQTAAITPDGQVVAAGSQDSVLRIWNGATGELVKSFMAPKAGKGR